MKKFWIIFLLPTFYTLGLLTIAAIGISSNDLAGISTLPQLGLSLFSAIWCGIWIARSLAKDPDRKVILALFLCTLLFGLNLVISMFGCSAHLKLNLH